MLRRVAVIAALALTGMLGAAGAVSAAPDPYPPVTPTQTNPVPPAAGGPSLSVGSTTVVVGGTVTMSGTGFEPGTITITSTVGNGLRAHGVALLSPVNMSVTADSSGTFSAVLTLTDVGRNTITATDSAGHSASMTVLVVAASSADNGGLPNTGVDGTALTLAISGAVVAILFGAGLIWLGKTRRRKNLSA